MTRVVITGAGIVSNVGSTLDDFWTALIEGWSNFRQPQLRKELSVLAGVVDDDYLADTPLQPRDGRFDRVSQMAIGAAARALRAAGLSCPVENAERVAVVMGVGGGGQDTVDEQYFRLFLENRRPYPLTVGKFMPSAPASAVSIIVGARGPSFATASACASAAHAIGMAAALVRTGIADIAIAGGAEACLTYGVLSAWDVMRIMSRSVCRPFALGRDGLIISEGAGALVLESEAHARARGAHWDVELAGFGSSADAGDMFQPAAEGMQRAIRAALADSGLQLSDIDYINAHGTGTRSNDSTESAAIKTLFGPGKCPPMSSTKGVTGHALGAAAAIEAVATVLAIQHQTAPPTANHNVPDPECDIDCIPNSPRALKIDSALSNSFGFGGLNAALAFRRRRPSE